MPIINYTVAHKNFKEMIITRKKIKLAKKMNYLANAVVTINFKEIFWM